MSAPQLKITEFTDPGCPFAWSAEPVRRRLEWLFGDELGWELRMVGLSSSPDDYLERGFTPEKQSAAFRRLAHEHHMPIDTSERPRMAATVPACRAIVGVRRHAPEKERSFLRAVRVHHFSGELLDEPATVRAAARDAGLDPDEVERWTGEPETEAALDEDLGLARDPIGRALALSHKLASTESGHRYTCPSYEIERLSDGIRLAVPGFQPFAAYEVTLANLCPELERRPDAERVDEALGWAGEPLATAEVAAVCGLELEDARERLGRIADEQHLGFEGFWHLNGRS